MKKLIVSLVLVVLASIISLGWSISEFATLQNPDTDSPGTSEQLAALKLVGVALSHTLDEKNSIQQPFIDNWNRHNQQQLSLTPEASFALPPSLKRQFNSEQSLLLESDEGISLHYLLPNTEQVLNIKTQLTSPEENDFNHNELYTMLFYFGVVAILLIWVSPLIKQLLTLSKTTQAFGMGELQQRIAVSKTSYIGTIETEFNRMADRIQQLIDDNKLLSRAVSHDLKTPIARLRFGIEVLEETQNDQLRLKYFQRLNRDIDAMEELVATLLNYARLDQANIQPELQAIEINAWLEQKLSVHAGGNLQLEYIPYSQQIIVNTDPKYLSMQIANLLSNAERFGQSKIMVRVELVDNTTWLHVEDDGHGIDEAETEQVVKPFVRGQQSRDNAGHGMGLAIVKRIGGWMGAELVIGRSLELGGAKISLKFK
ncbi:ATP-binding region, ATPase-like:Histidine kinase, HAMP region:Histidine kinase A [Shewanella piezotolerans WP3]|uniref:histidine kinase n=1 Tax=Shewanella piezotolerans (strain WP3 / JCM 13877) TaxID=225849 RepID=B8CHU2_SHEPW|nr:ATP-binding protein [Shewanella piezotolerans]ACJ27218.1 ATP-binding region, ATPase-like:Histidine kinase, HAMP region:Histidine kinase A [Shewanella piezotolerans WP3]